MGHVPPQCRQAPPVSDAETARALWFYETLPKPVFIHRSAGRDRTGTVVNRLQTTRLEKTGIPRVSRCRWGHPGWCQGRIKTEGR